MSMFPHVDMGSSMYSYIAIVMSRGLERRLAGNSQPIPMSVLREAQNFLSITIEAISGGIPLNPSKSACAYHLVADILRKTTKKKYSTREEMNSRIIELAHLVNDLDKLEIIPTGQIDGYKRLQNFFETLSRESESNYYYSFMSGKPSEYIYVL